MEMGFDGLDDGQVLAGIDRALDVLTSDRPRLHSARADLELLQASLRIDARLRAWQAQLAARIDATDAAWNELGVSTRTWLAESSRLTAREAARLIASGAAQARLPVLAAAATAGAVWPQQADAITDVLTDLPDDLPADTATEAQELMVGFAATHNSTELRRLSGRLLEVLAPDTADTLEAARIERDHRKAVRNRHLSFVHDHHGSILIRGSLPVTRAEAFIKIIDSYTSATRRALDALDPNAEYLTPAMARADGLLAMVEAHHRAFLAPAHGGDRPRVVVTLSYERLLAAATETGLLTGQLLGSGDPVPAGILRQWLCDADIMPAVLGGAGEVLDVGRTQRLVTPAIRAALELRDRGCVFPGCDKPPSQCHAHHITPWWAGGGTCLTNLVLLCAHHHGIVEPGHDPRADRWEVRLASSTDPSASGLMPGYARHAEILPPRRVDPWRHPRVHTRYQTPMRR